MGEEKTSKKGMAPQFDVFQIMDIEGREKGKFFNIGAGFTNTDGSINLLTVHGTLQIRAPRPKTS